MKKRLIAPVIGVIIVLAGSAYALVANLFPDTVDFPRIPVSVGTLGYAIAEMLGVADLGSYAGDGTVENTDKLAGLTASGYLHHNECIGSEVWVEVGADGMPICGQRAVLIGSLTGVTGTVAITKGDGSTVPGSDGDYLYVGDIISTDTSSSGTIAFTDASIIRLDELTTVELAEGTNTDGETIAQVILANGDLWGRVLTSSGINFEAGGYIAGVRGTSISVEKSLLAVTFSIVDSALTGSIAGTIDYERHTTGGTNGVTGSGALSTLATPTPFSSGTVITVVSGSTLPPVITQVGKNAILAGSDWARENTLADMSYMFSVMENSTTSAVIDAKVEDEFRVTVPITSNTANCIAFADDATMEASCLANASTTNHPPGTTPNPTPGSDEELDNQTLSFLNIRCLDIDHRGVYWPLINRCMLPLVTTIDGVPPTTKIENVIWMADFSPLNAANTDLNIRQIAPDGVNRGWETVPAMGNILLKGRTIKVEPVIELSTPVPVDTPSNRGWYTCFEGAATPVANPRPDDGYSFVRIASAICTYDGSNIYYSGVYQTLKTDKAEQLYLNNSGTIGFAINVTREYLAYPISQLMPHNGKVVQIDLSAPIGSRLPPDWKKVYIADFGSEKYFVQQNKNCLGQEKTGENWLCKTGSTVDIVNTKNLMSLKLPILVTPYQFIIGNTSGIGCPFGHVTCDQSAKIPYPMPIGTSIKSIRILQSL